MPLNYRAGWGYMMLTNFLPGQGNGTYKIYAYATDKEGNKVLLGTKTITCDNSHAVKPFGTIDSPSQGGSASGSAYPNFGWVLTPQPKTVPIDGSTIQVYIDSILVGALNTPPNVYNQYRVDVSSAFPGLKNSDGPVGAFFLDTTKYSNGVHTIAWVATDDQGAADGIGSRYFSILNTGTALQEPAAASQPAGRADRIMNLPMTFAPLRLRPGFNRSAEDISLYPDNYGVYHIEMREVDLLEISLSGYRIMPRTKPIVDQGGAPLSKGNMNIRYSGYLMVGDELRPLPIGSTLDPWIGTFSWMPGPGFVGSYDLAFIRRNPSAPALAYWVKIVITPKQRKEIPSFRVRELFHH